MAAICKRSQIRRNPNQMTAKTPEIIFVSYVRRNKESFGCTARISIQLSYVSLVQLIQIWNWFTKSSRTDVSFPRQTFSQYI